MLGLTPAAVTLPLFLPQAPPDKVSGLFHAATLLAQMLGQGRALDSRALRSTMEAAFGSTDAEGAWVWKDAYEALEAAQVLLGHSKADVTQVYAEKNEALAVAIASKIG